MFIARSKAKSIHTLSPNGVKAGGVFIALQKHNTSNLLERDDLYSLALLRNFTNNLWSFYPTSF